MSWLQVLLRKKQNKNKTGKEAREARGGTVIFNHKDLSRGGLSTIHVYIWTNVQATKTLEHTHEFKE